jgi:hypothetical protein
MWRHWRYAGPLFGTVRATNGPIFVKMQEIFWAIIWEDAISSLDLVWDGAGYKLGSYLGRCELQTGLLSGTVRATNRALVWDGAGYKPGSYLGRCGLQTGLLSGTVRATTRAVIWDGADYKPGSYLGRCGQHTGPIFVKMRTAV